MISGSSGDWIGSAGAAQGATASPAVAGQVASPVSVGSFAEAMRQSTQTDSETKKTSIEAGAVRGVPLSSLGKVATKRSNEHQANELGASVEAQLDVLTEAASTTAALAPRTPKESADLVVQDVTAIATLAQQAVAAPTKTEGGSSHLPAGAKSTSEEHGKAKTAPGVNSTTDAALDSATATGDGVSPTVGGSTVADAAAQAGMKPGAGVAPVDPAISAVDKGSKGKAVTIQIADGTTATALLGSVSTVETATGKSQGHDVVATAVATEGSSVTETVAVFLQSSAAQNVVLPVHGAGVIPTSAATAQGREETVALAVAQSHGQSAWTGELTLSSYDSTKLNQLEVGLEGGEFGWLKVRAEMGGNGEVNAYLRGASSSATDLLQTQAPRIEAYLGASDVVVNRVHVETIQHHVATSTGVGGDGSGKDNGAPPQQGGTGSKRSNDVAQAVGDATGFNLQGEEFLPVQVMVNQNATGLTGTGNWLSIRA